MPTTGSCARNGAKIATSRAQLKYFRPRGRGVEKLVAARPRRELGLRRRDGREDELPPRRARVQLAAGDQGRRADAGARWRGARDEQCCLEEAATARRHRVAPR